MPENNQWMNDEALQGISPAKLIFLQQMLFESRKYSGKELLPFLMSLAAKSRSQNIAFTRQELDSIIYVLKKYASEEEVRKMDQAISLFRQRQG